MKKYYSSFPNYFFEYIELPHSPLYHDLSCIYFYLITIIFSNFKCNIQIYTVNNFYNEYFYRKKFDVISFEKSKRKKKKKKEIQIYPTSRGTYADSYCARENTACLMFGIHRGKTRCRFL